MTSERPRFPVVLTILAALGFAICCGLGVWQLQRAAWKAQELARIAALQHAAPVPLAPVLARLAKGEDVSFTRVSVTCSPAPPGLAPLSMTTDNGDWIARVFSVCGVAAPPFHVVVVDRGFLVASRGQPNAASVVLPQPAQVTGVLFPRTTVRTTDGGFMVAPEAMSDRPGLVLVAERETPPPPGVTPAPYPDPTDNLQYVGAYWITWFGLAGALAAIYAAVLWRRYHPKR
jgi:surfeit locus 1 family protein